MGVTVCIDDCFNMSMSIENVGGPLMYLADIIEPKPPSVDGFYAISTAVSSPGTTTSILLDMIDFGHSSTVL
jgi:hypothetical protein